ncbi:plasmid stability protein StbB [Nitratireductor aestuarii]|uniref:Ribonuclease VapC n=1 Tax=Nitratireductor aestuarii TaxID=1735103 RepID=A0A916S4L9_9HYPH|nr:type II toxin-antitoxin system VapC family toxin [Nitratireductor aestuarii]GGA81205.1 plasmid stability protein StbB [Nitratireductor aestuarii]
MILLDTNVVSEPLRPSPDTTVVAWIDAQPVETLYLSAMTVAELRAGVAVLPAGRRRERIQDYLETGVLPLFAGRILPFDLLCASAYADILSTARRGGKAIATADAIIAATARANGLVVATRDVSPFAAAGLKVINPWAA